MDFQDFGDAEIREHGSAGLGEQNVGGLDVAVDDLLLVGIFQRAGNRGEEPGRLVVGHGMAELLFERAARQVIHHDIRHAILIAVVVDMHDVGVGELGEGFGLTLEALEHVGALSDVGADDFERDMALQLGVEGFVDRGHAAFTKLLDNMISSQVLTDEVWHLAHVPPKYRHDYRPKSDGEQHTVMPQQSFSGGGCAVTLSSGRRGGAGAEGKCLRPAQNGRAPGTRGAAFSKPKQMLRNLE